MIRSERALGLIGLLVGLLVGLVWVAPAGANPDTTDKDYLLTQPATGRPTGARLQIGTGLPLPVGPDGIFAGGMSAAAAATWATSPGVAPLLLIAPAVTAVTATPADFAKRIKQTGGTAQGGALKIPASVLEFTDPGGQPNHGGVFNTNPVVFDVATTIDYQWPSGTPPASGGLTVATLCAAGAAGCAVGGPGPALFTGPPGGASAGTIVYSGGTKAFGGPATFAIAPGPNAGSRLDAGGFPVNPTKMQATPQGGLTAIPIATVFLQLGGATPQQMTINAVLVAASSGGLNMAAQGASTPAPSYTTNFGPVVSALRPVNMQAGPLTPPCTAWCVGPNGTIMGGPTEQSNLPGGGAPGATNITYWSVGSGGAAFTHNNATTEGFPWTTGNITLSQMAALGGPEVFFLAGTDLRNAAGVGNISLVSGSLSDRNLSGPNSNRGFLSLNLPEPGAALGAAGALGLLAVLHSLVRRRSR